MKAKIRWKRLIWDLLVTLYFINFFRNLFRDALPNQPLIPTFFFISFTLWMAVEYYFGSPFFQSGVVEASQLWKNLWALFYYPFLGYCTADFVWTKWSQMGPLSPYVNFLGLAVFLFGIVLRFDTLRTVLSVTGDKLVRRGLFRRSRHPRYLATLVQVLAVPLVYSSWSGLLLALAIGIPLILVQVKDEEARLRTRYKDNFVGYQQTVPILLPRLGRRA